MAITLLWPKWNLSENNNDSADCSVQSYDAFQPESNVKLVVAYDGSNFHGLAPNPGVRTVVGEIVDVLKPVLGFSPEIVMSGRTDAGVHANAQVLSFLCPTQQIDVDKISKILNARLAPEVVVKSADSVGLDFSARFSAKARHYRYQILNQPLADPFMPSNLWWLADELNLDAMNQAASCFVGIHDFSSFCRKPKGFNEGQSLVREVYSAQWLRLKTPNYADDTCSLLEFNIEGSAFCHQMVRSIVGFLVAVGRGKRKVDEVGSVLEAKDRSKAETLAPPEGLTLWRVDY